MKNLGRPGKAGEWAIACIAPPYPTLVAKINKVTETGNYLLETGNRFTSLWDPGHCATFGTETEARGVYGKFVNNRNNYSYEG